MVRVRIEFDDSRLLEAGRAVILTLEGNSEKRVETEIEKCRFQHGRWVAKLKNIDSISEAEGWIGGRIWIPRRDWPETEKGSFYSCDLEGCAVYQEGDAIGRIVEVLDYGSTVLLRLDREGEEILIPFARSFLKQIDTQAKRIDVELPDGLIEVNRKLVVTSKKEEKTVNTKTTKFRDI
jgi:16S rRNA processing protein RimM